MLISEWKPSASIHMVSQWYSSHVWLPTFSLLLSSPIPVHWLAKWSPQGTVRSAHWTSLVWTIKWNMHAKFRIKHCRDHYGLNNIYTSNVSTDVKSDNDHLLILYVNRSTICEDTWGNNGILQWARSNKEKDCLWIRTGEFHMLFRCKSTSNIDLLDQQWDNHC